LQRRITPLVTVWHGDHPQCLEDAGGWPNRDMIHRYADYAAVLFEHLSDRVKHWITLNEPNCFLYQGYGSGLCPPGATDWKLAYQAVHNALVAHGTAVARFRECGGGGQIGITMSSQLWTPAADDPRDVRAAELADLQNNLWLLDPLHGKGYPQVFAEYLGELAPEVRDGDLETMATPTDFLGVNYYQNMAMKAGTLKPARHEGKQTDFIVARQLNDPAAFTQGLLRLHRRYGPRVLYVTENGLYQADTLGADGSCRDPERVAYLAGHIPALLDAIRAGVDVRGYCVWSLMDNFEWSAGYTARYGLFFTDYASQRRIPKESAKWYREWIRDAGG
jgi:beta-glucosidase